MGRPHHSQHAVKNRAKIPSVKQPGNAEQLVIQAYDKLESGNVTKAAELAEKALIICTNPTALDSLGEIFSIVGNFQKAANCYAKALGYDHSSHAAGLRYVTLYEITGDLANLNSAIAIFRKHIDSKESKDSLILALAMLADAFLVHLEVPNVKMAIKTAKEAIDLDPTQIEPHISLAGAHLVAESFELAEKAARDALSLMESSGLFSIERAEDGEEELIIHPNDNQPSSQFLQSLSRICTGIELYEHGAMCCDLILAQNPKDAVALHDLAWCYNLAGEYEDARDVLLQVKKIYLEENADEDLIADIEEKIKALSVTVPADA